MGRCGRCGGTVDDDLEFCPLCGERAVRSDPADDGVAGRFARPPDWNPRAPLLSVAVSLLLLWAAAHALGGPPDWIVLSLFFGATGVAIHPRARLALGRHGGPKPVGPSALETVVVLSGTALYVLLSVGATALLYAGAAGDAVVPGSRFAPVQALAAAVVLVAASRRLRHLRSVTADD